MKTFLTAFLEACFIFLCPLLLSAQTTGGALTFFRLNSYIGYVIDSTENSSCQCVKFAGRNFSYGSLVQLPDSNVVFRLKLATRESFVDVPMTKKEIANLSAAAAEIQNSISSDSSEQPFIKSMTGDSLTVTFLDYYQLKYQAFPLSEADTTFALNRQPTNTHTFLNIGLGISQREGEQAYLVLAAESGFVKKRHHVITFRFLFNKVPKGIFSSVTPLEHIYEAAIMYGWRFGKGTVMFTANAGVGYSSGILKGKLINRSSGFFGGGSSQYESVIMETIGLPAKVEMLIGNKRRSFMSIGLFADFNSQHSYQGFLISGHISGEYRAD